MPRWLALYVDKNGAPRASVIKPGAMAMPFGVDEFELGLADFDGEPVALVELPEDEEFRPTVVDVNDDRELPLQFIDLA